MRFGDKKEMLEKLAKKAHAHLMDKRPFIPHAMDITEYALYIFDVECYDILYSGAERSMVSMASLTGVLNDLDLSYNFQGNIENSAQVKLMKVYKGQEGASDG